MMKKSISLPKEKLEDWQQELMDNKYIQGAIQMAAEEAAEEAFKEGRMEGLYEGRMEGRMEGLNEGRLERFNEGRTKGLIEGRMEERKFLIQQLLNQGFTKQQIMELLDLDPDAPFEY